MVKKLFYLFVSFMLVYFFTSFAKDLSDMAQGKQAYTWFNDPTVPIIRVTQSLVFCACSFAAYLVFIKWYASKGLLKTVAAFLGILLLIITARYVIDQVAFPYFFGFRNYPRKVSLTYYYLDSFGFCFYYSTWGLAFFFFDFVRKKELEQKDIQLQNRIAELSFLRSQVNPHFLFNSVNNIYALVATQPEKALPALEQLSTLMRYMLYETEEKVLLKKELGYLVVYIALQKIRYVDPDMVEINISLEDMSLRIAPLLLIPFVENVFKHGDIGKGEGKAIISISAKENRLTFNTVNRKKTTRNNRHSGIGLDNVRRRLQLIYPSAHLLHTEEKNGFYTLNLILDL